MFDSKTITTFFAIVGVILFYAGIIKSLFIIAKNMAKDTFTLNFEDVKTKILPNCKSYSISIVSFDNPEFNSFTMGTYRFKGFFVRLFITDEYLIFKFFDKALLVDKHEDISLLGHFWGKLSVNSNGHSAQFTVSPKVYHLLSDWTNKH